MLMIRRNGIYLDSGATVDIGEVGFGTAGGSFRVAMVARNHSDIAPLETSWTFQDTPGSGSGWFTGANTLIPEIGAYQEDSFVLRMADNILGTHKASMSIYHNDLSKPNPFVLNFVGKVVDVPRIQVRDESGQLLTNASTYGESCPRPIALLRCQGTR